jgi:hypothetical protein
MFFVSPTESTSHFERGARENPIRDFDFKALPSSLCGRYSKLDRAVFKTYLLTAFRLAPF